MVSASMLGWSMSARAAANAYGLQQGRTKGKLIAAGQPTRNAMRAPLHRASMATSNRESVCACREAAGRSHANRQQWPAEPRQCSSVSALDGAPAAANGNDAIVGFQHVAIARDLQALVAVGHNQCGLRTRQEWQQRW